jgi:rhodanese-related sulfurtransferase
MLTKLIAALHEQPVVPAAPEITIEEYLRLPPGTRVQVIDVREPEEWALGRMPESVLIPMDDLAARMRELDPAQPVVTVCRSGRRSLISAAQLLAAGFSDVKSLAGGMIAWVEAGQPVER